MSFPAVAVVIPAYKVSAHIKELIKRIPDFVNHIIVVDDKWPESSGMEAERLHKKNLIVIYHERNEGVGGAVITGTGKPLNSAMILLSKWTVMVRWIRNTWRAW